MAMNYSEEVMDHFMNPRNVGEMKDANAIGEVGNQTCGDIMRIFLKINDDEIIEKASFLTFGCGSAIATSSMATEMIIGKNIHEAVNLSNKAVTEALGGLPPVKIHCSVLAEQAIKAALLDYSEKTGIEFPELENFDPADDPHDHEDEDDLF